MREAKKKVCIELSDRSIAAGSVKFKVDGEVWIARPIAGLTVGYWVEMIKYIKEEFPTFTESLALDVVRAALR